ncbi:hypothetical protein ACHAXS_008858 [Conticribra weissflogii]
MLLYLDGHTCPDIAYIVNYAGSYKSCPELVHEHALKQLCYYLNANDDKGLIMNPYERLQKIASFPNNDFAEIYGHKAMDNHLYVKNRILKWS